MSTSDDDRDEWIAERAAIREHDGGMPQADAEAEAVLDWRAMVDKRVTEAQREIHAMAGSARRSIGQHARYAGERLRRGQDGAGSRNAAPADPHSST